MGALLLLGLLGIAALAWASIVFIIPSCERDVFSYHLWNLRDQMVNELYLKGNFTPSAEAKQMLGLFQTTIDNIKEISPFKFWLSRRMGYSPVLSSFQKIDLTNDNPEEKKILLSYLERYEKELVRYAYRHTYSGWLCFILRPFGVNKRALFKRQSL